MEILVVAEFAKNLSLVSAQGLTERAIDYGGRLDYETIVGQELDTAPPSPKLGQEGDGVHLEHLAGWGGIPIPIRNTVTIL